MRFPYVFGRPGFGARASIRWIKVSNDTSLSVGPAAIAGVTAASCECGTTSTLSGSKAVDFDGGAGLEGWSVGGAADQAVGGRERREE